MKIRRFILRRLDFVYGLLNENGGWIPIRDRSEGDNAEPVGIKSMTPLYFTDTESLKIFLSKLQKTNMQVDIELGENNDLQRELNGVNDIDPMIEWITQQPHKVRMRMKVRLSTDGSTPFAEAMFISGHRYQRTTEIRPNYFTEERNIMRNACSQTMSKIKFPSADQAIVEPYTVLKDAEKRTQWNFIKKNIWISAVTGVVSGCIPTIINHIFFMR